MQNRKLTTAALAIVLSLSALGANAQPRGDDRGDRGRHGHQDRRDHRDHRDDRDRRDFRDHRDHRAGPGFRPGPPPAPHAHPGHGPRFSAHPGRGVGPGHRFHRGDRLPPGMRHKNYYVDDWRGHRLSAPPRGYRWVQVDADYVLVAVATGLIASIILSH